jgi:hypothetical protein
VVSGKQTNFTPFEKTRVMPIAYSNKVKDRILIGLNNRDPRWHDVHSLDLATGKLTLLLKNEGYGGFLADEMLNLRVAQKSRLDGGSTYYRLKDGKADGEPLADVGLDDSQTTAPLTFTVDGKTLYWTDSRNRNTSALVAQEVASGKTTILAQDQRADIANALYDTKTGEVQAYERRLPEAGICAIVARVERRPGVPEAIHQGPVQVTSRTEADDKWLVSVDAVTAPPATWLYDRKTKKLTNCT